MKREIPVWLQILGVMARRGRYPGLRLGTIEEFGRLPRGTATHQRLQDARRHGWEIECTRDDGAYFYTMTRSEQARAREFFAKARKK